MLLTCGKTYTRELRFLVTQRRAPQSTRGQRGLGLRGGEGRSPHVLVALLRRQPVCRLPGSASGHVVAGREERALNKTETNAPQNWRELNEASGGVEQ